MLTCTLQKSKTFLGYLILSLQTEVKAFKKFTPVNFNDRSFPSAQNQNDKEL